MLQSQTITTGDANGTLTTWGDSSSSTSLDWTVCNYYHWHYPCHIEKDTMRKAFSIVKALMDEKLINIRTVKQFVNLVDKVYNLIE